LSFGLFISFFVIRALPSARESKAHHKAATETPSNLSWWDRVRAFFYVDSNGVSTYANIAAVALLFIGGMQLMIIHGAWFADQYGFGARELGLVAFFYGLCDLVASVSVSIFTDRFGKRRSVILGSIGAIIGYLLIPWFSFAAIPAVVSTGITRGFFEFAIVANLPLLSTQAPNQRAKVMTLSSALTLLCLTLVSFTVPSLYESIGIVGIAIISAASTVIALLLMITRVREVPEEIREVKV
jgi:predicted MFS family arabinose efflux permease